MAETESAPARPTLATWSLDAYTHMLACQLEIWHKVDAAEAREAAASLVHRFSEDAAGDLQLLNETGQPMEGGIAELAEEYLHTKEQRRREAILEQKREMLLDMESELADENAPNGAPTFELKEIT